MKILQKETLVWAVFGTPRFGRLGSRTRLLLKGRPTRRGGGGGLWPVRGWVWFGLGQFGPKCLGSGWVGGRMVRQPLFVPENTIFTEGLVVKSGPNFQSAVSGD